MLTKNNSIYLLNSSRKEKNAGVEELSLNSNVRESMAHLPSCIQPLLTWITGRALLTQKRSNHTPYYHLTTSLLSLLSGWGLIYIGGVVLTVIGMILVTGALRKLQIVIVHHCSHSNFFSRKSKGNAILGNIISFSLFIEPFKSYKSSHSLDHHFSKHMTKDDPTVGFLFNRCKIAPGMSVEESKKRIFMNFLNPSFYIEGLLERFKEQNKMNLVGKMSMAVMWMLFLAIALATGSLSFFLLALVVPLFVLYPISSALRLSVEHTFPETQVGRKFDLDSMSILTNAVYCGEKYPKNSNPINIALWSCKMLLLHLPIRVFVLVGDTPVHDHHHRHPIYKDWPNYAFARIEALESETGNYEYREVWGYFNALTHTLKSLKQAKY